MFEDINPLNKMASFFFQRTKTIQSNIANADTPFYKPMDLKFEKVLKDRISMKLTNPKHINPNPEEDIKIESYEAGYINGYDLNKVNIEEEMAKLAESSIMHQTIVEMMKKEMAKLKYAISGK